MDQWELIGPRTPEPSRHTTGRGRWRPPVKRLLPAVFLFSCFFVSHPALQAGSRWNLKKELNEA